MWIQKVRLMAHELSRHNVEHELITMRGKGHGFDGDMRNQAVKNAFCRILSFIDAHMGAGAD